MKQDQARTLTLLGKEFDKRGGQGRYARTNSTVLELKLDANITQEWKPLQAFIRLEEAELLGVCILYSGEVL